MITAGIDSAELTGIAILDGDQLVKHTAIRIDGWETIENMANEIASYRPDLVAIEAPFVRLNAGTGLALARLLGRWLQTFERRGIPTTTVLGSTWQLEVLKAHGVCFRTKSDARKLASRAWALETFGGALSVDESDACGIAAWAAQHFQGLPVPADPRTPRLAQTARRAA